MWGKGISWIRRLRLALSVYGTTLWLQKEMAEANAKKLAEMEAKMEVEKKKHQEEMERRI